MRGSAALVEDREFVRTSSNQRKTVGPPDTAAATLSASPPPLMACEPPASSPKLRDNALITLYQLPRGPRWKREDLVELLALPGLTKKLVNRTDRHGRPPLWYAVALGLPDIVDALLALGAEPNTFDLHGKCLLERAAMQRSLPMCASLIRAGIRRKIERLPLVVRQNCPELVTFLLQQRIACTRIQAAEIWLLYHASPLGPVITDLLLTYDRGWVAQVLGRVVATQNIAFVRKIVQEAHCDISNAWVFTPHHRLPVPLLIAAGNAAPLDLFTALIHLGVSARPHSAWFVWDMPKFRGLMGTVMLASDLDPALLQVPAVAERMADVVALPTEQERRAALRAIAVVRPMKLP